MDSDVEFYVDCFGQHASLWNLYTQLSWCFPLSDITTRQKIVETLTDGLGRLTESFPWIAGQVVKISQGEGKPEYYVIRPLDPIPRLIVKDLSKTLPAFEIYKQDNFPLNLLDESAIAPRRTNSVIDESDPKPVFLLQVTFITGGLFLTFAAQHGTMDIVGEAEVIKLLSKACYGIPFTQEEIRLGTCDRRHIIPILDLPDTNQTRNPEYNTEDSELQQSHADHSIEKAPLSSPNPTSYQSSTNIWTNFLFPQTSLLSLKSHATTSLPSSCPFISTDDALSTFIWQRITCARSPRYPRTATSTFYRTVDLRRYLSIPESYPGNLATKVKLTHKFSSLQSQLLGVISSQLRSLIDPKISDLAHKARVEATRLANPATTTQPSSRSSSDRNTMRDLSKDIALSSWSKIAQAYDLDFNLGLGKAAAVLRPTFTTPPDHQPMEGVVYLLPKRHDGGIIAMICLREDDMERLKGDQEWKGYARWSEER